MTLVLRKCWADGHSSRNFFYGNVGDRVTAPIWNPEPECGNGLHGLRDGNGNWYLLQGVDWLIIDADDQIVDIDRHKCKFNTGIIKFRGTAEELAKTNFCNEMNIRNGNAFSWVQHIGNEDQLCHKITESKWAYIWARDVGNRDVMISKISESKWAYYWAVNIGDKDVMIDKITDSEHAYLWARDIGDKDVMVDKITEPKYAYLWALNLAPSNFDEQNLMKRRINTEGWIETWNFTFHNNKIES